jgi:carbon monoxide dehydrogenase subunit G
MELNGEVFVNAPRPRVWAALNDTEVLRRCIPGCETMEATGEHEKTAIVAIKIGPVRARFSGRVRMDDIREGEGCTLQFDGQGGAAGMARGASRVELSDEAGGTRLRYQTQASVAGKLGQVGGRMIDAAARQMADQFFAAFQAEVAPAAVAEAAAETPAAAPEVPAQAEATAAAAPPAATAAAPLPAPAPARLPARPPAPAAPPSALAGEASRVLWFVLGALSTGFGVWLARTLFS